jgi:hypothetical protein
LQFLISQTFVSQLEIPFCLSSTINAYMSFLIRPARLLGKIGMAGDLVELREICLAALV